MPQQLTDELFESHLRFLLTAPSLLANSETQPVILPSELVSPNKADALIQQLIPLRSIFQKQLQGRRSGRLGIYYETLWGFILQHLSGIDPGIDVLAANLPVRNSQRTLGEYDLICQQGNKNNKILHLELAIKFYLGLPDDSIDQPSSTTQWVGPGLRDRLDIKLQRLFHHQLTLANLPEGKAAIINCAGNHQYSIVSKALVQGRLFYPWQAEMLPPDKIGHDHCRGDWLPQQALESYVLTHPNQICYQILKHSEWLTACTIKKTLQKNELVNLYPDNLSFSPIMIAAINQTDDTTTYFFLVSNDWQQSANAK